MKNLYTKSLLLFIVTTLSNIFLFTLFRVIFFMTNYEDSFVASELWQAFYIGFKFDLRLALTINLPILFLGSTGYLQAFRSVKTKRGWQVYLVLSNLILITLYIMDFALYDYLGDRLNASAYRYLYNPDMSMGMLTSAYPFVTIFIGIVFSVLCCVWFFRFIFSQIDKKQIDIPLKKTVLAYIMTFLFSAVGLYGQFASFPLTWSNAYFSTNYFVSSLTINPILHLGESVFWEVPEYDEKAVQKYMPEIKEYLGISDLETVSFDRTRTFPKNENPPNIVIVFMESLAFHKSGLSGNPLNATPNFDKIAKESVFLNHFYTPHRHTARSIFALVTGLPDIGLVESTSRNPMFVKQDTILNAFTDYEKLYFLGGNASWSNIRGIISHNIKDLKLFEEHMYQSPKLDVWGISDLHLFEEFISEARKIQDKPFIALIQTSGNHSPFLIPSDNRGFEITPIDKKTALQNGFKHSDEYNSLRFMDHSFGIFIEKLQSEAFFKNTIFCFFGDHGKRVYHHELAFMPKAQHDLNLTHYHVPCILYAPHILPPRIETKIASEVDILPTLAHLASVSYTNKGLGKDLFDPNLDHNRFAFTLNYGTNEIGLIDSDYYFLCSTNGQNKRLHDLHSDNPLENVLSKENMQSQKMEKVCRGLYEINKYIRAQKNKAK